MPRLALRIRVLNNGSVGTHSEIVTLNMMSKHHDASIMIHETTSNVRYSPSPAFGCISAKCDEYQESITLTINLAMDTMQLVHLGTGSRLQKITCSREQFHCMLQCLFHMPGGACQAGAMRVLLGFALANHIPVLQRESSPQLKALVVAWR